MDENFRATNFPRRREESANPEEETRCGRDANEKNIFFVF